MAIKDVHERDLGRGMVEGDDNGGNAKSWKAERETRYRQGIFSIGERWTLSS